MSLDRPRDVCAPNASLGRTESEAHNAHQVGLARHQVPVSDMDAGRTNAHQHVVLADHWLVDLLEVENVR